MSPTGDLVELTATCLCRSNVFKTEVSSTKLPLEAWTCHCGSCRHVTGAMYSSAVDWPEKRASVDVSRLKAYTFSPNFEILSCPTCSTPMFFAATPLFSAGKGNPEQGLSLFTGTLKNAPDEVIRTTHHIFVGDTQDGGATMWLRKPNADGTEAKRYPRREPGEEGGPAEPIPYHWPPSETLTGFEMKKRDPVPIWCKCKGVKLVWQPGSYEDKKAEELPWFVDPVTHKALAGFCACESCRLFGGVDIWNWGFAELKDIQFVDRPGFPDSSDALRALVDAKDPSVGTLTYFASSSDAQRYFCSNCSASIFYAWDNRTFMVDLALGVLEAADGARAEGYFSWALGGSTSHLEENAGGWRYGLFQRVLEESEQWRIERNYPKNWRRVAREMGELSQT